MSLLNKSDIDGLNWNDGIFENQEFTGLQCSHLLIKDAEFQDCVFKSCIFIESAFIKCKFEDCKFQNSDLSLVKFDGSSFINSTFDHSKCVGINWLKVSIPFNFDVRFSDSNISNSNFLGLNLQHIQLLNCIAMDVNFEEANLTHANCTGTDFNKTKFHNCDLTKANFSNAKNYSIDHKYNKLKKAIFSLPEAMSLLNGLDIVLKS